MNISLYVNLSCPLASKPLHGHLVFAKQILLQVLRQAVSQNHDPSLQIIQTRQGRLLLTRERGGVSGHWTARRLAQKHQGDILLNGIHTKWFMPPVQIMWSPVVEHLPTSELAIFFFAQRFAFAIIHFMMICSLW